LAPALLLAAFSHLHYMLFPTIFTEEISTGDLLRVGLSFALLVGLIREVRAAYLAERERRLELAAAYEVERSRVHELQELDRAKAELFGILTHELAHPVATVRGYAITLLRRWDSLDDPTRLQLIEHVERESARVRDLAEEATTVTQMESPGLSLMPRPETAMEIVRQVADATAELDGKLKVKVGPGAESAEVKVDLARILQVFSNLLSNAENMANPTHPSSCGWSATGTRSCSA
jgi:signal transduction histidine kinase